MGEVSSEISGVLRVKSGNASVGKTNDLKNIVIDGNEIELKAGVYTYNDVPVNDVSAFKEHLQQEKTAIFMYQTRE